MHSIDQRIVRKHGIRIPYVDEEGSEHYYSPDFLSLDGAKLYEVKGWTSARGLIKFEAAHAWCSFRGMEFIVIDRSFMDDNQLLTRSSTTS